MKLSDFVRNQRKDNAQTQKDLAKRLNVTVTTVCNIENGKNAGPKVLKALAKYYKMETRFLRKMMEEKDDSHKQ